MFLCKSSTDSKTTRSFSIKVISIDYLKLGGCLLLIFSSPLGYYGVAHALTNEFIVLAHENRILFCLFKWLSLVTDYILLL